MPRPHTPAAVRFPRRVNYDGPLPERRPDLGRCHLWTGPPRNGKYGQFTDDDGRNRPAHVWAWEQVNGPVPSGFLLDHFACDRKLCVNEAHCRPVTPRENVLRSDTSLVALNRAKERCPRDHPYVGANLYVDRTGRRSCRTCGRENMARYRAERAARAAGIGSR
jgi:hypothetical protein